MRRLEELDRLDGSGSHAPRRRGGWMLLVAAAFAAGLAIAWPADLGLIRQPDHRAAEGSGSTAQPVGGLSALPPLPTDAADRPLGTPPPAPRGDGTYRFFFTQADSDEPVTYDPCRPIHWVIRPDGTPRRGRQLIEAGIEEISGRTGLQFVYDGETAEDPSENREPLQPDRYGDRWVPVLIAWSDEDETAALEGRVAGVGGSTYVEPRPGATRRYVTGQVVLDGPDIRDILRREPDGFEQAKAIVMHELAHVVGLEHVDDEGELMHPENTGRKTFGVGDRQGLERLGRGQCHRDT